MQLTILNRIIENKGSKIHTHFSIVSVVLVARETNNETTSLFWLFARLKAYIYTGEQYTIESMQTTTVHHSLQRCQRNVGSKGNRQRRNVADLVASKTNFFILTMRSNTQSNHRTQRHQTTHDSIISVVLVAKVAANAETSLIPLLSRLKR